MVISLPNEIFNSGGVMRQLVTAEDILREAPGAIIVARTAEPVKVERITAKLKSMFPSVSFTEVGGYDGAEPRLNLEGAPSAQSGGSALFICYENPSGAGYSLVRLKAALSDFHAFAVFHPGAEFDFIPLSYSRITLKSEITAAVKKIAIAPVLFLASVILYEALNAMNLLNLFSATSRRKNS